MWYAAACPASGAVPDRSRDPRLVVAPREFDVAEAAPRREPHWDLLAADLFDGDLLPRLRAGAVEPSDNDDENRVLALLIAEVARQPDEAGAFDILRAVASDLRTRDDVAEETRRAFNAFYAVAIATPVVDLAALDW
jgi:hypothetical protein